MKMLFAFLLAIAALVSTSAFAQHRERERSEPSMQLEQAPDCKELKLACDNKDALGEGGQGNCRTYREQCGRGSPRCQELRSACLHKNELGEGGAGNCRAYREQCRQ